MEENKKVNKQKNEETRFEKFSKTDLAKELLILIKEMCIYGLQGTSVLDPSEHGLSLQLKGYPLLPEAWQRV